MSDLIPIDTRVTMEDEVPRGTDEHFGDATNHPSDDYKDPERNDDSNDDDDSDDYDLMSMEAPLLLSNPRVGKPQQHQHERPPTGVTWSTSAIRDCLTISLQAHNNNNNNNQDGNNIVSIDEWTPPLRDEWKPRPVPLPEWAMPVKQQPHQHPFEQG